MEIEISHAIILGFLQGLGEFLPISSTAHLILAPWFLGWNDPGLSFDVALHLGTLIAVVSFFWRDWLDIFKGTSNSIFHTRYAIRDVKYSPNLLWLLVIASVPGAILGVLFNDKVESLLRAPLIIAIALSLMGLVLYLVDEYAAHKKDLKDLNKKDALLIGLSQAIALIPGVSRSGATMTAGLSLGLSREGAARFSFLLSTPIIFGAAIMKLPHLFSGGISLAIILGIVAAAVSGFLAIKYMLKLVQKYGYAPFFWYRLILAAIIVVVYIYI
jgi:undecaprenyl-diphosphatase